MGIELCLFEEGFSLKLIRWFIKLRFLNRFRWDPEEVMESWGFSLYFRDHYVAFHWGNSYKHWYPFGDWTHVRHQVLRPDGTWVKEVADYEVSDGAEPDGKKEWTYAYHYCKSDWVIQEVIAKFHVEEREWRWQLRLPFGKRLVLPWPRRVCRSIDITFSDEVGDRSGSWKGGCIGCGYTLNKDETPMECIRRMERERKFR